MTYETGNMQFRNKSTMEKRQIYAVFILLDRYYRMNFNIHEAIPDWWKIREEEWTEHYDCEFLDRDSVSVQVAFSSRLEALLAFFNKIESFAYENAERIQIEIELEQKKLDESVFQND